MSRIEIDRGLLISAWVARYLEDSTDRDASWAGSSPEKSLEYWSEEIEGDL